MGSETTNMGQIPTLGLLLVVAIIAFAFFMGLSKGFRRVGKSGFYWLMAGGAFIFLYKGMAMENPLANSLTGDMAKFAGFAWAFVLVVACIFATLIFFGACAALFRPSSARDVRIDLEEICEYDPDNIDKPVYVSAELQKRRSRKPGILSRLFGGITCAVNVGIIVVSVAVLLLMIVQTTKLSENFGAILQVEAVVKIMEYAKKYFMDFATVGLIFLIAAKGFKTGFVGATRILVKKLGLLLSIVLGVALVFVAPFNQMAFVTNLCEKFGNMFSFLGEFSTLIGSILTAIFFMIIFAIIVAIINKLLKKLKYNIQSTTVIRIVDGTLAGLLYFILGAIACIGIWAIVYVLEYVGICAPADLFQGTNTFAGECYNVAKGFLESILDTYLIRFKAA